MAQASGFPPLNDRRSRARARALVVGGDRLSRFDTRALLEMSGFEVTELNDGLEAITLLDLNPPSLDIVVLDYEMPFLNGLDTFQALWALHPGLQGILCTAKDQEVGADALPEGITLLNKPFTRQELVETLSKISTITIHG